MKIEIQAKPKPLGTKLANAPDGFYVDAENRSSLILKFGDRVLFTSQDGTVGAPFSAADCANIYLPVTKMMVEVE